MTYGKFRRDFEYLETIAELNDKVEIDSEVENFMRNPTKRFAAMLYEMCITAWLDEHGTEGHGRRVKSIARRHFRI